AGAAFARVAVEMTSRQKAGLFSLPDEGGGEATLRLDRTFHYRIPPKLVDQIRLGHLVWVSFGRSRRQGIIVGFDTQAAVSHTKDLSEIAVPDPVLQPHQIKLAYWLSRTYLAPLFDSLSLMLPPGILQHTYEVVTVAPGTEIPATLPPEPRTLLEWLQERGEATIAEVEEQVGSKARVHPYLRQLTRRGLVRRETRDRPPSVRPKQVTFVRLLADVATQNQARLQLGHDSPQANALLALAESADPLPTEEALCARAGCTTQTIRTLAKKGWVARIPARTVVEPLVSADRLREAEEQSSHAPRRAALLRYLRENPGPILVQELTQATGSTPSTLKPLEEQGLTTRRRDPAAVYLALPPAEVMGRVYALRGSTKQQAILDYLQRAGQATPLPNLLKATGAAHTHVQDLQAHNLVCLEKREVWRDPLAGLDTALATPPELTADQQRAWQEIRTRLSSDASPRVILVHGVTGSGKTELYLQAVTEVIRQGRQAIVLVPEIALTPQTIQRFAARFPERLTVLHSQLSLGERYDSWRRIQRGEIDLVIGSRSALFAPLPRLGLVVLDEAHEWTYKQEGSGVQQTPHYHARDTAQELAHLTGATVILGSATPDMESAYRARRGDYLYLRLAQRIMSGSRSPATGEPGPVNPKSKPETRPLPPVQVVDLRQELRAGNTSIFSRALQESMETALAAGEQVILFLNRRGSASFVLCRDCGYVMRCPRCDVTLSYHDDQRQMTCHHCNTRVAVPTICPECWSRRIKFFGLGTQKLEAAVQERFPEARTLRWDRDTTGPKGAHGALLRAFSKGEANVLIGTQMVAKGLDLPMVTLVGVISADTALHLPDFRAAERTFQLLTQVAGRAGRGVLGGKVVVQSYSPQHYAIQTASRHDFDAFYRYESSFRREQGYPPFGRLVKLLYLHRQAEKCQQEAQRMGRLLQLRIQQKGLAGIRLVGPAPCYLTRLRGYYRWQIIVRASDPYPLLTSVSYPIGWRIDVDPVSLL
ncbi:MAG: primosomal protein N', partial [Chloroflexi bacterium]|nr:primosomal protein N' [Chloroflexota bacterium]